MQWIFVRQPDLLFYGYPSGSHPTNSPVTHISNIPVACMSFWCYTGKPNVSIRIRIWVSALVFCLHLYRTLLIGLKSSYIASYKVRVKGGW